MGACVTCCYSCLNAVGLVSDDSVSRRKKVDSLLSDRNNLLVDGRKASSQSQSSIDEKRAAHNGPAYDKDSPKGTKPMTSFSPLTNPKEKQDLQSKRSNFGSFRKPNSRGDSSGYQ